MSQKTLAFGFAGVMTLGAAASASATLLAYDPFNTGGNAAAGEYTVGPLPGQQPVVHGFRSDINWGRGFGNPQIVEPSLSFPGVSPSGGHLLFPQNDTGRRFRELTPTASVTADTVGTRYISFLMQLDGLNDNYRALEFFNAGQGDGARTLQFGLSATDMASATNFGVRAMNNNAFSAATPVPVQSGVPVFVVLRLDLTTVASSDALTAYVNPSFDAEAGNVGTTISGLDLAFDQIALARFTSTAAGNGNTIRLDEFRIGTTFESVLIPEPGALLACASGAVLMLRRRRA